MYKTRFLKICKTCIKLYVLGLRQNSFIVMSSLLFWDVMWLRLVVIYQLFRATFQEIINNLFAEYNQQDVTIFNLSDSDAAHVSDGFSIHHQELKTAHTTSGFCQTNT